MEIDIEFIKGVAVEAGGLALQLRRAMQTEFKADSSYVTTVDREVERFVQERLETRYPGYAFWGEEYGWQGSKTAPLWAVDPIDGTTNMVFNLPFWGVSIGLVDQGTLCAGAVYLPCTGELFWAVRGQGAYCNGTVLRATDRTACHPEDTLGFTSRAVKMLNTVGLQGRIRCLGSIAADLVYTARGTLCCLIGWNEGFYDMAAGLCVAQEAGCIATYLTGEPLDPGELLKQRVTRAPFIVAPPEFAAHVRSVLNPDNPLIGEEGNAAGTGAA
ncbi:MAG: inositol monophosphatase [Chloroherpetonaceae bacterium]|nr:inositol monophosphatase [Chthonomonadaceae bacterium]MDW8206245.1 inositol monophosphatase [Chloroherpetonaceae bacterium]